MVLLLPIILLLGVLAGLAIGGRVQNLAEMRVRWWWLAPIALLMQVVPVPSLEIERSDLLGVGFLLGSYVLLLLLAAANIRRLGFAMVFLGIALNFVVIGMNHGMPVSEAALRSVGDAESIAALREAGGKHHLADEDDVLLPLADVIPIPVLGVVVSAGDVITYSGAAVFVAASMRTPPARARHRSGQRPRRATRSGTRR